jgi:thiol-disulfide isomerase/thioredoxin
MLVALLSATLLAVTGDPEPGPWRAWLDSPGGELPFRLILEREGGTWRGALGLNGEDPVGSIALANDELVLRFDPFDSEIRARVADEHGRRLEGEWTLVRAGGRVARMPFHAVRQDTGGLFRPSMTAVQPIDVSGRWAVRFSESEDLAVGLFDTPAGAAATGTFLTTTGDYRYLAGDARGELRLACFDGAHAFLFRAQKLADGTLAGDFWSRDSWHETWTATLDPKIELPDAFELTRWNQEVDLAALRYPDVDGTVRALDDPSFAGKARLVVVFGTWCPNCNDEARLLAELDATYRSRGLAILGLAFEHEEDHAYAAGRVRAYAERHGLTFPILIAGTSDKAAASEAFPLVDRVRSFPTTLFLDAGNRVRAVHSGFSGPATGKAHEALREAFERRIVDLLSE